MFPLEPVFQNAKKLGLTRYYLGFNWIDIDDTEDLLIKEGFNDIQERTKELEKELILLQNYNYKNKLSCFKKLHNKFNNNNNINNINIQKKDNFLIVNDDDDIINDTIDNLSCDSDVIVNSDIDSYDSSDDNISDDYDDNNNDKKSEKKNNENKKNIKKIKNKNKKKVRKEDNIDNIDEIMQEIKIIEKENDEKTKKDLIENEEKYKEIRKKKHYKSIKKLKNKVKEHKDNGDLDIIEANLKTKQNDIHEYFFHLREETFSEEHTDINFKKCLINLIINNKNKFDNICNIIGCEKIYFDEEFNLFKLYVKRDDPDNYQRIINATILISNVVGKIRGNINKATNFFRKTALVM